MLDVAGVSIGHDVGDACLGGGLDELAVGVAGSSGGDSNDKELLALEGSDNGVFIVVVDGGDNDTLGQFVGAVFAREGSDGVFSGFQEGFSENRANSASSLVIVSLILFVYCIWGTYTDNGDFLDGVGEAGGLILSVRHCVELRLINEQIG